MLNQAIGDLLPAAVAVALSPIPIIAVVLVLGAPAARTTGPMFALGWIVCGIWKCSKACGLQVLHSVDGVPVVSFRLTIKSSCPAYPEESSWRDPAEQVVKLKVTKDGEGSLIIRASGKSSKSSAQAVSYRLVVNGV